jgi:quinoprotein glucose dehydrogenase
MLFELVSNHNVPGRERARALETLGLFNDAKLSDAITLGLTDDDRGLRVTAGTMLGKFEPDRAAQQLGAAFADAAIPEKKAILTALGDLKSVASDTMLAALLRDLRAGKVAPEVQLELLEAAAKRKAPEVRTALGSYESGLPPHDPLAKFAPALAGGDLENGEQLFKEHAWHNVTAATRSAAPEVKRARI